MASGKKCEAPQQDGAAPELQTRVKKNQSAAICFRIQNGTPLFLLERTRDDRYWTIPKGKLERRELDKPWKGAKREAREEAGVTGKVYREPVGRIIRIRPSVKGIKQVPIEFFLLRVKKEKAKTAERKYKWFPYDQALEALGEDRGSDDRRFVDQTRAMLREAAMRIHDLLRTGELSNSRIWWKVVLRPLFKWFK